MTDSPFSKPSGSGPYDRINWQDLNGALLVVEPHSVETGIKTSMGERDAVRATVHVLDGPLAGTTYQDTLVFPRALAGQLGRQIGATVLGRLGKGEAKSPGQSAPWVLKDPSADDEDAAMVWLAARAAAPIVDDLEAPF